MGLMKPNVTVIYANATVPVESETPWVVPVESWLEEVVEEHTTSIPTTSSTSQSPSSTPLPNATSSTTTSTPTTLQTVAIVDERNTTFALLPSSGPASSSGMQRHGSVAAGKKKKIKVARSDQKMARTAIFTCNNHTLLLFLLFMYPCVCVC